MKVTKPAEYRKQLARFHKRVIEDSEPLRIHSPAGDVVILSAAEYENLYETMRVLADPITMQSIESTRQTKNKRRVGVDWKAAFRDLVDNPDRN